MAFKLTYSDGQESQHDDDTVWEIDDGVLKLGGREKGKWSVLLSPSHWAVLEIDGTQSDRGEGGIRTRNLIRRKKSPTTPTRKTKTTTTTEPGTYRRRALRKREGSSHSGYSPSISSTSPIQPGAETGGAATPSEGQETH